MKHLSVLALSISLLVVGSVQADEVLSTTRDNTAGKAAGGVTGLMLGAAAGGPIGAVVGAGIGWLAGWGVQDGTGLSDRAYRVRNDQGKEVVVRSPNHHFAVGEQVDQQGGRLYTHATSGKDPASGLCNAPSHAGEAKC